MKTLITGISGFAGSHLAELLLREGEEVAGISYPGESTRNISHILDRVQVTEGDVASEGDIRRILGEYNPDIVYHLAGFASVGQAWGMTTDTLRVNAMGLVNLVLAGRESGNPTMLVVGSGEMYGLVDKKRQPIREEAPLAPINPYGLSKVWQEQAACYFVNIYKYPLVIVRPFNHTGPRQSPRFVCSDFARQIAEIEAGRREAVIRVGNLTARRDFLDVRDIVSAYRLAAFKGRRGIPYNIASMQPYSIRDILDILLGLCRVPVKVTEEKERFRPVDIPLLTGDYSRLREETGWEPTRELSATLEALLDYWREEVADGGGTPC